MVVLEVVPAHERSGWCGLDSSIEVEAAVALMNYCTRGGGATLCFQLGLNPRLSTSLRAPTHQ